MKDPESDIERVLAGLRDSPLPRDMEDRILATLEERRITFSSRWFALSSAHLKIAAVCSLAIAATLVILFFNSRHPKPTSVPTAATIVTPNSLPPTMHTGALTPHTLPPIHRTRLRQVQTDLPQKEASVDEVLPVSAPAPPSPLTEQERFLLRMARQGRTENFAQISNESKAAKEKQEAAEFQAFFEPPLIKIGESE